MIESFLSVAGSIASIYGLISEVKSGKNFESIEKLIKHNTNEIQKLSDDIIYLPNRLGVIDTSKNTQNVISDLRDIREALEPIQKVTKSKIISSAAIETPINMGKAMLLNPWQVLIEPRPINLVTAHPNPDMVPILFEHDGIKFIGWQLKGTLPLLFGCELSNSQKYTLKVDTELIKLLRNAIATTKEDNGWSEVFRVERVVSNYASFNVRDYGYSKLNILFEAIEIFELKRKSKKNWYVRLKAQKKHNK
jgi:hypothetical protein